MVRLEQPAASHLRRPGAGRRFGRVIWPLNGYEGIFWRASNPAYRVGCAWLWARSAWPPCAATGSRQALLRFVFLTLFDACAHRRDLDVGAVVGAVLLAMLSPMVSALLPALVLMSAPPWTLLSAMLSPQ
jgi:hypothetical protein